MSLATTMAELVATARAKTNKDERRVIRCAGIVLLVWGAACSPLNVVADKQNHRWTLRQTEEEVPPSGCDGHFQQHFGYGITVSSVQLINVFRV